MEKLNEKKYDYLFSVIMPFYKTEEYIEESIESILQQTIGFEENIQLILVNNSTSDSVGKICEQYRERYPDNIVYVELTENLGFSGRRNAGIPYVRGKYVNFFDSDDKWAPDAFGYVDSFLRQYADEISMVACRMRYFDTVDAWDMFDYKFEHSMVCSIHTNSTFMQFNSSSVILKAEVLQTHRFDEDSKYAEDLKFISEIILETGKYGLLREAVFLHRHLPEYEDPQMQTKDYSKEWYLGTPRKCYLYLVELSKRIFGKVLPYVQYILMQEMTWRIMKKDPPEILSASEFLEYLDNLRQMLNVIDDYIIWECAQLWKEFKLTCLKIKYGTEVLQQFEIRNGGLVFNNLNWCRLDDSSILVIVEHHVENGQLYFDGKINLPFPKEYYEIFAGDNCGNVYPIEEYPGDESNIRWSIGSPCLIKRCFRAVVPLKGISEISFYIRWERVERKLKLNFGKFAKLTNRLENSYCVDGGYLFYMKENSITIESYSESLHKQKETAIRMELVKKGHKRGAFLRFIFPLAARRLKGKEMWLISDRPAKAGDNGEFLFRHLHDHPLPNVIPYFAISKKSPDYKRMRQYGKVVDIDSLKYQILFLTADKIMSATWGIKIINPLDWHQELVRDLFRYKFIYLDHALTKDDISYDVNKHSRNFSMWTTGAQMETESIYKYPYGYLPNVPQTTGLARYDAIYQAINVTPEKRILLAPTWRKSLAVSYDPYGMVEYNDAFKQSEFLAFYNRLINDERLLSSMRDHGYKGFFKLHPLIAVQAGDFSYNDVFSIQPQAETYEKEFFENGLVVTDYSSIAMDFAFAKRSVIYAQFDKEEFYRTHSYHESYFDYEKDGFGPVCYDYESTVQAIIHMIETDCVMEELYAARRERFFAYLDNNNCERICEAILSC